MRVREDLELFSSLRALQDARENDDYPGTESDYQITERLYYRQQQIISTALVHPHAIATTGITAHHFEVKSCRASWLAILQAMELIEPGQSIADDDFESIMRELSIVDYGENKAKFLLFSLRTTLATQEYVLRVLVPEIMSRFNVKIWDGRFGPLCQLVTTTEDMLGLAKDFRSVSREVAAEPEPGRVGKSIFALANEYDITDKDTRNIVPMGVAQFDKAMGGGPGRGDLVVVGGGTSTGKCLAKYTKVLKFDGTVVDVQDIVVGDLLMGFQGEPRRVLRLNSGKAEMYTVVPKKGASWQCNKDHILTLEGTGKRGRSYWGGQIVDVSVAEWLSWSKFRKDNFKLMRSGPIEFGVQMPPPPIDPYLLGVLIGDGGMSQGTPTLCNPDRELVEAVRKKCKEAGVELNEVHVKKKHCPTYTVRHPKGRGRNRVTSALRGLGLMGHRAWDKFIPDIYKRAPKNVRLEILAGLIDTDGHHRLRNGVSAYDWVSASKRLAEDVVFVARSLGMSAYVAQRQQVLQTGRVGTYYRVHLGGPGVVDIPCRIGRKKPSSQPREHNHLRTAFDVIATGVEGEYFGFTLDGDGRFLLGDFTVTHNSYAAQRLLRNYATARSPALYISVEDSEDLMQARFFADYDDRLTPTDVRKKAVDPVVLDKAREKMATDGSDQIYFLDAKKWTVSQVCSAMRRHRYLFEIDTCIVDYLQAIQPDEPSGQVTNDTALIVSALKKCAHEIGVVLILFSQLARDEYRNGAEPGLNSCKWAGEIENETEFMVMMWRDDDDQLHCKIVKCKWNKASGLRFVVHTNPMTGIIQLPLEDDFSPPPAPPERKKYGNGNGNGNGRGGRRAGAGGNAA